MTLPIPILTALASALAGAIIGGIVSDFVTRRRERRSRRIRLVGELAAFYGRVEAALMRFQRIRIADEGLAFSEATYLGLADVTECEGDGHKLYWDIREAFRTRQVSDNIWELTRRISLTKTMLVFTESPVEEFAQGMNWINSQGRDAIAVCAKRIGLRVHKDHVPFFLGLGGAGGDDAKYRSPETPWKAIQHRRANEAADKMWAERSTKKT
jgi:hypothetical protein